jgi:hypothetical protein
VFPQSTRQAPIVNPKPHRAPRKRLWPFVLVLVLGVAALGGGGLYYLAGSSRDEGGTGGGDAAAEEPEESTSPEPDPEELRLAAEAELQAQLDAAVADFLASEADDNLYVAIAVEDEEFHLAYNGDEQYETASIVKTEILAMMLREFGTVDQIPDWAMTAAEKMIRDSDNEATNEIFFGCWDDPHAAIAQAHIDFGLTDTTPNYDQDERWGQTLTTANDQLTVLETALYEGTLSAEQVEVSRDLMGDLGDSQQWGVDAAAAEGETVWMKNGWDTREVVDADWVVNSIGVIAGDTETPIEMSILTGGSVSEEEGIERIEELAVMARQIIDSDPYANDQ